MFGITPKREVTPLNAWRARTIHDVICEGSVNVFGFIVRWVVAVGLVGWIFLLLSQVSDRPLFELTVAQFLKATSLVLVIAVVVGWALRSGKKHYSAWAWLGVAAILLALYLAK